MSYDNSHRMDSPSGWPPALRVAYVDAALAVDPDTQEVHIRYIPEISLESLRNWCLRGKQDRLPAIYQVEYNDCISAAAYLRALMYYEAGDVVSDDEWFDTLMESVRQECAQRASELKLIEPRYLDENDQVAFGLTQDGDYLLRQYDSAKADDLGKIGNIIPLSLYYVLCRAEDVDRALEN